MKNGSFWRTDAITFASRLRGGGVGGGDGGDDDGRAE